MCFGFRNNKNKWALLALSAVVCFFAACSLPIRADDWKLFESARGFSLTYPANWYRLTDLEKLHPGVLPDDLSLLDAQNGGLEGAGMAWGHADIQVFENSDTDRETLSRLIADDNKDGSILLERKDIPVRKDGTGCKRLTELVVKSTFAPEEYVRAHPREAYQIFTNFFCEASAGRNISVGVGNWEFDKRQAMYQQVGRRMAESIRLLP